MTADVYYFDKAFLKRVSSRITNEIQGISRVAYDREHSIPIMTHSIHPAYFDDSDVQASRYD